MKSIQNGSHVMNQTMDPILVPLTLPWRTTCVLQNSYSSRCQAHYNARYVWKYKSINVRDVSFSIKRLKISSCKKKKKKKKTDWLTHTFCLYGVYEHIEPISSLDLISSDALNLRYLPPISSILYIVITSYFKLFKRQQKYGSQGLPEWVSCQSGRQKKYCASRILSNFELNLLENERTNKH